jgi:catechol 2,3-dioxygenase-like lactoylglutathione lyase family enzyme
MYWRCRMSLVQLALNVSDLEAAIKFYSKLFDAEPAKVRPGYANFAIAEPPLKLVLIEDASDAEPVSPAHSTTLGSRSRRLTRFAAQRAGCRMRVSPRWSKRRRPAAMRSRTRSG